MLHNIKNNFKSIIICLQLVAIILTSIGVRSFCSVLFYSIYLPASLSLSSMHFYYRDNNWPAVPFSNQFCIRHDSVVLFVLVHVNTPNQTHPFFPGLFTTYLWDYLQWSCKKPPGNFQKSLSFIQDRSSFWSSLEDAEAPSKQTRCFGLSLPRV